MVIRPARVSLDLHDEIKKAVIEAYVGDVSNVIENGEVFLEVSEWIAIGDAIREKAKHLNWVANELQRELNLAVDEIRKMKQAV